MLQIHRFLPLRKLPFAVLQHVSTVSGEAAKALSFVLLLLSSVAAMHHGEQWFTG